MKNKKAVILSLLLIVIVFFIANTIYTNNQNELLVNIDSSDAPFAREHSTILGNKNSKFVVVEWFDPQCIACKNFHPSMKKVLSEYKNEIKLVLRPLGNQKYSKYMIRILYASKKQNLYKEVLDIMYITQDKWANYNNPKPKLIWKYLKSINNLDINQLKKDSLNDEIEDFISLDFIDANRLNVKGTPTFYVNKIKLKDFSYTGLLDLVEEELYKD